MLVSGERLKRYWVVDIAATLARSPWTEDAILLRLKYLAEKWGFPMGSACMWCRIAITGTTVSEPVHKLLAVVDKDRALGAILKLGGFPVEEFKRENGIG